MKQCQRYEIEQMEKDREYYESLDKRTKEYKEWKASQKKPVEGLGDVVEKITEATGIKSAVEFLMGKDCGCDKRKEKLNKLFPIRSAKPKCMNETQYYAWKALNDRYPSNKAKDLTYNDRKVISELHAELMGYRFKKVSSCVSCLRGYINDINKIYSTYESK